MFIFVRFTSVSEVKVGMSFIQMNWDKCPEKVHMLTHSPFIQLILVQLVLDVVMT